MSVRDIRAAVEGAQPVMSLGAQVLDQVFAFIGRFLVYPSEAAQVGHTLWIAHAHLMAAWESTPRIAFLSPEPASGKTRALEVSELLVPNPVEAFNVSAAYIFRKVGDEAGPPTLLFDEIDTVFGPKARENEEIRALLNAGHRRGAVAGRCVVRGKTIETEDLPAYCAVALAGLGDLPDTILSRSVIVRMRRRAPGEHIQSFRRRVQATEGHRLRDGLAAWALEILETVTAARPAMPEGIEDRDADVWEPLLAVADAAGGAWPDRARVAAVALVALSKESTPSLGIRLLADLKTVFGTEEAMSTEIILQLLWALDEAPWREIQGGKENRKPLDARGLAWRLRPYGVKSITIRLNDGSTPKGYKREALEDPWSRYLPLAPQEAATSATENGADAGKIFDQGTELISERAEIDRQARADGWEG